MISYGSAKIEITRFREDVKNIAPEQLSKILSVALLPDYKLLQRSELDEHYEYLLSRSEDQRDIGVLTIGDLRDIPGIRSLNITIQLNKFGIPHTDLIASSLIGSIGGEASITKENSENETDRLYYGISRGESGDIVITNLVEL